MTGRSRPVRQTPIDRQASVQKPMLGEECWTSPVVKFTIDVARQQNHAGAAVGGRFRRVTSQMFRDIRAKRATKNVGTKR